MLPYLCTRKCCEVNHVESILVVQLLDAVSRQSSSMLGRPPGTPYTDRQLTALVYTVEYALRYCCLAHERQLKRCLSNHEVLCCILLRGLRPVSASHPLAGLTCNFRYSGEQRVAIDIDCGVVVLHTLFGTQTSIARTGQCTTSERRYQTTVMPLMAIHRM